MNKLIFFLIGIFFNVYSQSFTLDANQLYLQIEKNMYLIKNYNSGEILKGYDLIDSTKVFIAYNNNINSEASTQIVIYDIITGNEIFITELGGTGESYFKYNKENNLVIFNWFDGIYIFELPSIDQNAPMDINPKLIIECQECFLPFWINHNCVGYLVYIDEKLATKYFNLE